MEKAANSIFYRCKDDVYDIVYCNLGSDCLLEGVDGTDFAGASSDLGYQGELLTTPGYESFETSGDCLSDLYVLEAICVVPTSTDPYVDYQPIWDDDDDQTCPSGSASAAISYSSSTKTIDSGDLATIESELLSLTVIFEFLFKFLKIYNFQ